MANGRTTKPRRFWLSLAYRKPTPELPQNTARCAHVRGPHVDLDRARVSQGAEPFNQGSIAQGADAVALSRRAWRPSAVDSLFQYRDALNDHLRAT